MVLLDTESVQQTLAAAFPDADAYVEYDQCSFDRTTVIVLKLDFGHPEPLAVVVTFTEADFKACKERSRLIELVSNRMNLAFNVLRDAVRAG